MEAKRHRLPMGFVWESWPEDIVKCCIALTHKVKASQTEGQDSSVVHAVDVVVLEYNGPVSKWTTNKVRERFVRSPCAFHLSFQSLFLDDTIISCTSSPILWMIHIGLCYIEPHSLRDGSGQARGSSTSMPASTRTTAVTWPECRSPGAVLSLPVESVWMWHPSQIDTYEVHTKNIRSQVILILLPTSYALLNENRCLSVYLNYVVQQPKFIYVLQYPSYLRTLLIDPNTDQSIITWNPYSSHRSMLIG